MPGPIIIKSPGKAPLSKNLVLFATGVLPFVYILFLLLRGEDLYFADPVLNRPAYIFFFLILPILFQKAAHIQVMVGDNGETLLCENTYLSSFRDSWWMLIMLWPAFVIGLVFLLRPVFGQGGLHIPASDALARFVSTNAAMFFYGNILKMRSDIRVSETGLRVGMRFLKWGQIHHVSRFGGRYEVYHTAQPELPLSCFRLTREKASLFEEYISRHGVARQDKRYGLTARVKLAAASGAALIIAAGLVLYLGGLLPILPVFAIALISGLWGTHRLEKVRRLGEIPLTKPEVEPREGS